MRCEKLSRENSLHLLLHAFLYSYTPVYYIRGRENRTTTKKKDRINTMTKEMYKQILHAVKRPETLGGIILTATYDNDITPKDLGELIAEMNKIIMKERG